LSKVKGGKKMEKANDLKLAKIMLGDKYDATVEIGSYKFHFNAATMEQQLLATVKSKNLVADLKKEDLGISYMCDGIALLDMVVDKMYLKKKEKDGSGVDVIREEEIKKGFWEYFKEKRSPKILTDIIIPLYQEYINFQNGLEIDVDELKNS
jgi:hypothetical protein